MFELLQRPSKLRILYTLCGWKYLHHFWRLCRVSSVRINCLRVNCFLNRFSTSCTDCDSGEVSCNFQCYVGGDCVGIFLDIMGDIETPEECLMECKVHWMPSVREY